MRSNDEMYISPRYADYKWGWQLTPAQIISGPVHDDTLLEHPNFSREGRAHLAIYRAFPEAKAIIHAHPFYVMPFCAAAKPIEPVLDAADIFGTVEPVPYAPPNSQELADNIVGGLQGKESLIAEFAAPVLMPRHGVMIAGKDLYAALETLIKIDMNAWCVLAQKMLD